MSDTSQAFHERLLTARPDVAERQKKNAEKRKIAIQLRDLRDKVGLTQADVAKKSGMTQSSISRMEALTGPIPQVETINKYVRACNGHWTVVISADEIPFGNAAVG